MDVNEMRRVRDEAVVEMHRQIEMVECVDLPKWALMTLMVPLFIGAALHLSFRMLWILALGRLKSPFIFVAVWADILGILWRFLRSSVERMVRK